MSGLKGNKPQMNTDEHRWVVNKSRRKLRMQIPAGIGLRHFHAAFLCDQQVRVSTEFLYLCPSVFICG
jgi:hypothetical protein